MFFDTENPFPPISDPCVWGLDPILDPLKVGWIQNYLKYEDSQHGSLTDAQLMSAVLLFLLPPLLLCIIDHLAAPAPLPPGG